MLALFFTFDSIHLSFINSLLQISIRVFESPIFAKNLLNSLFNDLIIILQGSHLQKQNLILAV